MITIASYSNASEPYIIKSLLESNGIRCEIKKDANSQPPWTRTVEIQVTNSDADEARELIESSAE